MTISRFYRDALVFDALANVHLPRLAEAARARCEGLTAWSAGCACGEEPYTLSVLWRIALSAAFPGLTFHVLATDFDETVLDRARAATYRRGSLVELPEGWLERGFVMEGDAFRVRPEIVAGVELRRADVRAFLPDRSLDLVLCRNLAFTYFAEEAQRSFLARIATRLVPGGLLVLGKREVLPDDPRFVPAGTPFIWRYVPT